MKLALFPGCRTGADLPQYRESALAVLSRLDVHIEQPHFNCCGSVVREKDPRAFMLLAIRNLAIAQARDLAVLTLCKCCFGALKQAAFHYAGDPEARRLISGLLEKEGLSYDGSVPVFHLLTLLDKKKERIKDQIAYRLTGLKAAPQYGCHALRPSRITEFDQPYAPDIFERVLALTGVQPLAWERRLECCGNPVSEKNPALSRRLALQKMDNAQNCGAELICTACSHCQIQFDRYQDESFSSEGLKGIPAVLVTQLLGVALGIDRKKLGLSNRAAYALAQAPSMSVFFTR